MAKKTQTPPKNFEEGMRELERILSSMESSEAPLEESLAQYERGTFLIQYCRQVLTEAEKRVETIVKTPDGQLAIDNSVENSET